MDSFEQMAERAKTLFASAEASCTSCHACTQRCSLLEAREWDLRALCQEGLTIVRGAESLENLREALAGHDSFRSFVLSCEGCDRCTATCPQQLHMSGVWQAAREMLRACRFLEDSALQLVKVDCTWDTFSVFRAVQGTSYCDLPLLRVEPIDAAEAGWVDPNAGTFSEVPQAETLFFPGCSLVTYAPGVTRSAFAWLSEHVGPTLLSTSCCGSTLGFMGETERANAWKERVVAAARDQGVKRIVCVCPGCAAQLAPVAARVAPEIEFVPLARLLVDAGVRVDAEALGADALPVMVVDSCNDRSSIHGDAIRELFGNVDSVLSPCRGADARCCGAGGGVNLHNKPLARQRTRFMLETARDQGARTLVTACPTCAYTYAFERWESKAAGDGSWDGLGSINYLEAVFAERIDWPATFDALYDMWQGKQAAWVAERIG